MSLHEDLGAVGYYFNVEDEVSVSYSPTLRSLKRGSHRKAERVLTLPILCCIPWTEAQFPVGNFLGIELKRVSMSSYPSGTS